MRLEAATRTDALSEAINDGGKVGSAVSARLAAAPLPLPPCVKKATDIVFNCVSAAKQMAEDRTRGEHPSGEDEDDDGRKSDSSTREERGDADQCNANYDTARSRRSAGN